MTEVVAQDGSCAGGGGGGGGGKLEELSVDTVRHDAVQRDTVRSIHTVQYEYRYCAV